MGWQAVCTIGEVADKRPHGGSGRYSAPITPAPTMASISSPV